MRMVADRPRVALQEEAIEAADPEVDLAQVDLVAEGADRAACSVKAQAESTALISAWKR